MKKVPVFVVLIGCVFSWLIASMNPVTKIIDQSVYSYFNYQLMAIGIAISLFVGIILLWLKEKNNKTVKLRKISAFFYNKHLSIEGLYSLS